MTKEYKKALQEVYAIIKKLDAESYSKLPDNFIKLIEKERDRNYKIIIDDEIPLYEQKLLDETKAILAVLYNMYLTD